MRAMQEQSGSAQLPHLQSQVQVRIRLILFYVMYRYRVPVLTHKIRYPGWRTVFISCTGNLSIKQ
jgi:hypothetical protein